MTRRQSALSFMLLAAALPSGQTSPKDKIGCTFCPVPVDSTASKPLGTSDASHGCTAGTKNGYPIPDPLCTPGAVNPTVTLAVLKNAKFKTECIRNCTTKETEKNATYGQYAIPHPDNNQGSSQICELDHLVPLELGGADTLDNIWPQCGPNQVALAKRYFKQKDAVENYLADQVKLGAMDLEKAQAEIAADWTQFLSIAQDFCAHTPKRCKGGQ